jgi:hypothetical protein
VHRVVAPFTFVRLYRVLGAFAELDGGGHEWHGCPLITAVVARLPALLALTGSANRKIGSLIGLGAALVIAFGGFRAMQEEVAGEI